MNGNSSKEQSSAIAALALITIFWALPHFAVGASLMLANAKLMRVRTDSQGFGSILALFDQSPNLIGTAFLIQAALAVLTAWGLYHYKTWSVPLLLLLIGAAFLWGIQWLFAANQDLPDRDNFLARAEPDYKLIAFGLAQLAYGVVAFITLIGCGNAFLHPSRSHRRRHRRRDTGESGAWLANEVSTPPQEDTSQKIKRSEPYHRF
jgi:hypothetical protein